MTVTVHDPRPCGLGEGALWHPARATLLWFDIHEGRLMAQGQAWDLGGNASAAGWVDRDRLVVADAAGLGLLDLGTGARTPLCAIEADNPATRSNDGRADPMGGFWIGTMGRGAEPGAGAIYRWHRGTLRRLWGGITIPNAICFAEGGRRAHFTDTVTRRVMAVALDAAGWPAGEPETFIDLGPQGLNPDGAVIDAAGLMWIALWGSGEVAAFAPDGGSVGSIAFPAPHVTCPAFGGPDLGTLYCTSALEGMDAAARAAHPAAGQTFAAPGAGRGRAEPAVLA